MEYTVMITPLLVYTPLYINTKNLDSYKSNKLPGKAS